MKVQTTAGQLRAGLRLFRGIISRHNTVPMLGMVRMADGRLTGTDLDSELSVALPTIGGMEGAAAIDWRALATLAGCIDGDEELTIVEANNLATVSFNGSAYRMASLPVADFPACPAIDGPRTETGNFGLVAAMRRVRMAISTEETRYYLNGVALLDAPDGGALVAATNGHQLAMMPIAAMPEAAAGAIVPRNVVHWLCAQKHEPEAAAFSGVQKGEEGWPRVRFEFAGMTLAAKLIDGTFPDVFRVVPRDPQAAFSIDRVRLWRVLMRMRDFGGGSRARGVKLSGAGETLTLSLAYASEGRDATERLPLDGGASAPFECGFNVDYLVSILSGFTGERVTFAPDRGEAASSPCLITSDDDALRVVLMPMRV